MPYEKIKPGEWLRPKVKGYRMACCDCGLVHKLDFRVHTGRAEFRAYRDSRATKRLRARAEPNTVEVAGPKSVTTNQRSQGATQDRLSVSNNRPAGCANWKPKHGLGPYCGNCGFHETEHELRRGE